MKNSYIGTLLTTMQIGTTVDVVGWIKSKRHHTNNVFLDVCDSSGSIQIVITRQNVSAEIFEAAKRLTTESAIEVSGILTVNPKKNNLREVIAKTLHVIGPALKEVTPSPRSDFDIFDPQLTDHLLRNRHLYIRNPKIMAILRFRHILMHHTRQWFNDNGFIEIDAPILTAIPLYEDGSAMAIDVHDEKVFLTQCVGYYLEASVHAFEKVYNMGPSFRGEESRSKRHLMEYWHIKAEIAFGNREDIIALVESIIKYIVEKCKEDCGDIFEILGTEMCLDGVKTPFSRITYEDAIKELQSRGEDIEFGDSLGSAEESLLAENFKGPFWVVGIPREIEPFPYCIDPNDSRLTMVADLIASNGFGELLGVAEKIHTVDMLNERMKDKGKLGDARYDWIRDVHEIGCVPHIAFGMGVERMIRWLLNIQHVRDAIPFPRVFRRKIYP